MKHSQKGFTLIELLIVIALLGALAVGLLAALDPFEQLKKGNDTGVRNTVAEIHGGIVRYYAVRSQMPFTTASLGMIDASNGYTGIGIDQIVSAGELKSDFRELAGGKLAEITVMGTTESATVCFKPASKSFRSDQNTKYVVNAGTFSETINNTTNCGQTDSSSFSCFWCVK